MKKLTAVLLGLLLVLSVLLSVLFPRFAESKAPPQPGQSALSVPIIVPPKDEVRTRSMMDNMSTEEKVWQMLMLSPEGLISAPCSTDPEVWAAAFKNIPAGGIFFASANMPSADELRAMLSAIVSASEKTPFLALDEEGGSVARLSYTLGVTTDFLPMYEYREQGPSTAFSNALTIARDIASFGFNVNFAPVADVWTNPDNTVIGRRAYSDNAAQAAELVSAAVRGFTEGGVISTLKHFPGHGDTAQDSHISAATSDKTLEQLRRCEFLPFISGIEAGAGMVMVGHITVPEIDPNFPATLSESVITGLLRGELGFDGVVITDAFAMEALGEYDNTQAALMAIEAGCDIILCPTDPVATVHAILDNISPERIDRSVLRILLLKMEWGLI